MSSDEEFREEVRAVVRRHDPDPDALRALGDDLDALADRWESTQEVI